MRHTLLSSLIAGAAMAMSLPDAHAQPHNLRCDAHHRCRPTPQYSYEACYSLAHQRGWTDRRFDARGLNAFIYKCMLGQIPW